MVCLCVENTLLNKIVKVIDVAARDSRNYLNAAVVKVELTVGRSLKLV